VTYLSALLFCWAERKTTATTKTDKSVSFCQQPVSPWYACCRRLMKSPNESISVFD
jgi:hypothetical protein